MNSTDEKKQAIREMDRLRHLEAYHNNEERRRYHIEYELRRRREDPEYKARHNALKLASYHRNKVLKKQQKEQAELIVN
jgi:hypothetical protein